MIIKEVTLYLKEVQLVRALAMIGAGKKIIFGNKLNELETPNGELPQLI